MATFFDDTITNWVPDTIANWDVGTTIGDPDTTMARLDLDIDASSPTIDVSFVPLDYGTATGAGENALYITIALGGANVRCVLFNAVTLDPTLNYIGPTTVSGASLVGIAPGTVNYMRATLDASGLRCTGNETVAPVALGASSGSTLRTTIIVSHMTIALQSAVVYSSP